MQIVDEIAITGEIEMPCSPRCITPNCNLQPLRKRVLQNALMPGDIIAVPKGARYFYQDNVLTNTLPLDDELNYCQLVRFHGSDRHPLSPQRVEAWEVEHCKSGLMLLEWLDASCRVYPPMAREHLSGESYAPSWRGQ